MEKKDHVARFRLLIACITVACTMIGLMPALAEQSRTSANDPPATMPFDIPYGSPIALDQAQHLVAAAWAEAKRRGWKLNIAVVDTHGELVAFARMDGSQLASVAISQRKARIAARFRRETRVFAEAMEKGHANIATLDPDMVASPGGFPLVVDGKLIGAIGCSGGTGDQDALVCTKGVDALK